MKYIVTADPRNCDLAIPQVPSTLINIAKHYPDPFEVMSNVVYHIPTGQSCGPLVEKSHVYPAYSDRPNIVDKWPWFVIRVGRPKFQYGTQGISQAEVAFQAGPMLVEASKVVDIQKAILNGGYDHWNPHERIPQCAIGITADKDIVHGVWDRASLYEIAEELVSLGCVQVMKLDSGGSVGRIENGTLELSNLRKLAAAFVVKKVKKRYTSMIETVDIVLDPGHGGTDPGAVVNGHFEKTFNLASCLLIEKYLKRANLKVAMTRRDDSDTTLAGITEFANVRKAKLFYSEHHNWFRAPDVNGREWFRFPNSVGGLRLAESIERHLKIATDQPLRRWAESNFQVLRNTHMPAVLFEGGFMSNPGDLALMKDSDWLDRNALAKALGIIEYLKGV